MNKRKNNDNREEEEKEKGKKQKTQHKNIKNVDVNIENFKRIPEIVTKRSFVAKQCYIMKNIFNEMSNGITSLMDTISIPFRNLGKEFLAASIADDVKKVKRLLNCKNLDINFQNFDQHKELSAPIYQGMTALHLAGIHGCKKTAKLLLERGIDVSIQDEVGSTALHWTSIEGRTKIITMLLEYGADSNLQNKMGTLPLHLACMHRRTDTVKLLLLNGSKIITQTDSGWTPLHYACYNSHNEGAKLLVKWPFMLADMNINQKIAFLKKEIYDKFIVFLCCNKLQQPKKPKIPGYLLLGIFVRALYIPHGSPMEKIWFSKDPHTAAHEMVITMVNTMDKENRTPLDLIQTGSYWNSWKEEQAEIIELLEPYREK
jgi:ankyrin repeat protein